MKPLNRIPILCTVSILYLFIIGRNLSTKQTLAAARHAGSGECGQMTTWNAIRIKPWHPFSGPCWRCTYLPVLTLGMQCHLCCQTGIKQKRESASLLRAVEGGPQGNPTPGRRRVLSLSAMVLRSVQMGKRRQIQILIHSVTREGATDAAGGFLMPLCPYCR